MHSVVVVVMITVECIGLEILSIESIRMYRVPKVECIGLEVVCIGLEIECIGLLF